MDIIFWFPKKIISHGASNFTGDEMHGFCEKNKIAHHITAPYHPQSNGLVERYFATTKDTLHQNMKARMG